MRSKPRAMPPLAQEVRVLRDGASEPQSLPIVTNTILVVPYYKYSIIYNNYENYFALV